MSDFSDTNILRKIFAAIPGIFKPVLVRGQKQRWRDDFPNTSLSSDWDIVQVGNGQNISVANSELKITTGNAIGGTIIRHKKPFNIPCKVSFIGHISQRLANQSFYLEMVDSNGSNYARFFFNGTNASNVSCEQTNGGSPAYNFANLTSASTTFSSGLVYEIEASIEEVKFSTRQIDQLAGRSASWTQYRRIPDPLVEYYIQIRVLNTAIPANSTTLTLDSISVIENESISIETPSRGGKNLSDALTVNPGNTNFSVVVSNSNISVINAQVYYTDTTSSLIANGSFVSAARNCNSRGIFLVTVDTDQAGNLYIDQSTDNSTYLDFGARPCVAGINTFTVTTFLQYARIRYVNGSTAQSRFRIFSQLKSF